MRMKTCYQCKEIYFNESKYFCTGRHHCPSCRKKNIAIAKKKYEDDLKQNGRRPFTGQCLMK